MKMINRKLHITCFLCFPLRREDGWKWKAEKSWLAEAFNSLNRKALENLKILARDLNADYFILEKSEIKLNEKGDILPTIIMM